MIKNLIHIVYFILQYYNFLVFLLELEHFSEMLTKITSKILYMCIYGVLKVRMQRIISEIISSIKKMFQTKVVRFQQIYQMVIFI
jgi:hypothetical protein